MTRYLKRIAVFLFFATTLSLHAEDHGTTIGTTADAPRTDGTQLTLQAVPEFVHRILVPLLPEATNTFAVASQAVDEVIEAPAGFELYRHNGGLQIEAPAGEASGYARVRMGGRELTLTLVNLIPAENVHDGVIEGYQVGQYQSEPLHGLDSYRP